MTWVKMLSTMSRGLVSELVLAAAAADISDDMEDDMDSDEDDEVGGDVEAGVLVAEE